jgi:formyltetrahydrofolate deformylase
MLIRCADRPGIVAAVSEFLFKRGANIVSSQQYSTDPSGGRFFLRTEFFLEDASERERLADRFQAEVAGRFEMDWRIR